MVIVICLRISHAVVSTHLAEVGKLQAANLKSLPGLCYCYCYRFVCLSSLCLLQRGTSIAELLSVTNRWTSGSQLPKGEPPTGEPRPHMYVISYIYIYMYICIYIYIYVSCICIHVYIYIYIPLSTSPIAVLRECDPAATHILEFGR